MKFNFIEIFLRDLQILRKAKNVSSEAVDNFSEQRPRTTALVQAALVVGKWLVVILVLVFLSNTIYYYSIVRPQTAEDERKVEEKRKVLMDEQGRPRRECLQRLGIPDTGQLILPEECPKDTP